jgi:hypothetical protein
MSEPVSYRHPENGIQNASGRRPGIDRRRGAPGLQESLPSAEIRLG